MLRAYRVLPAACAALLGAGSAAVAAPAGAATIEVTTPCVVYVNDYSDPAMQVVGSGFVPYGVVKLSTTTEAETTPKPLGSLTAGILGSFVTEPGAAFFDSERTQDQEFTLTASDGLVETSTTFRQVRLGYTRRPTTSTPGKRVKHIARGFTPGETIWAHFRHKRKTRATRRLGKAKGPCGIARREMRALPARSRLGTWKVIVDEHKTFDLSSRPQVSRTFVVKPTLP